MRCVASAATTFHGGKGKWCGVAVWLANRFVLCVVGANAPNKLGCCCGEGDIGWPQHLGWKRGIAVQNWLVAFECLRRGLPLHHLEHHHLVAHFPGRGWRDRGPMECWADVAVHDCFVGWQLQHWRLIACQHKRLTHRKLHQFVGRAVGGQKTDTQLIISRRKHSGFDCRLIHPSLKTDGSGGDNLVGQKSAHPGGDSNDWHRSIFGLCFQRAVQRNLRINFGHHRALSTVDNRQDCRLLFRRPIGKVRAWFWCNRQRHPQLRLCNGSGGGKHHCRNQEAETARDEVHKILHCWKKALLWLCRLFICYQGNRQGLQKRGVATTQGGWKKRGDVDLVCNRLPTR